MRRIAGIIGQEPDELLAMAGRVASEMTDIIRERPREMADFLRAAKGLTPEDMACLRGRRRRRGRQGTNSDTDDLMGRPKDLGGSQSDHWIFQARRRSA